MKTISKFFFSKFISRQCFFSYFINGFVILHYIELQIPILPQIAIVPHYILLVFQGLQFQTSSLGSLGTQTLNSMERVEVLGFISSSREFISVHYHPFDLNQNLQLTHHLYFKQIYFNQLEPQYIQSHMNYVSSSKFPVCFQCNLSEELAKCDIEDRNLCGLVLCRNCREKYGNKQCKKDECKKIYKRHNFRKNFTDKYKKQLCHKFEYEFGVRSQWQELVKQEQLDMDMVHILAAMAGQNPETYKNHIRKQIQRLLEQMRTKRDTIQSQIEGRKLPVFIQTVTRQKNEENDGSEACGYIKNNYQKGVKQIIYSFQQFTSTAL